MAVAANFWAGPDSRLWEKMLTRSRSLRSPGQALAWRPRNEFALTMGPDSTHTLLELAHDSGPVSSTHDLHACKMRQHHTPNRIQAEVSRFRAFEDLLYFPTYISSTAFNLLITYTCFLLPLLQLGGWVGIRDTTCERQQPRTHMTTS